MVAPLELSVVECRVTGGWAVSKDAGHDFSGELNKVCAAGPLGDMISAAYGINRARKLAVIEMARSSGQWARWRKQRGRSR
jgi:glycerate kinase